MELVPNEGNFPAGGTHSGSAHSRGGLSFETCAGRQRLETASSPVCADHDYLGSEDARSLCVSPKRAGGAPLQLEAGPECRRSRRLLSAVAEDGGICVSSLCPNPARAQTDPESSADGTDSRGALVASTTVVSSAAGNALQRSPVDSLVS